MESATPYPPDGCTDPTAIQPRLTEITNHMHVAAFQEKLRQSVLTSTSPSKSPGKLAEIFSRLNPAAPSKTQLETDLVSRPEKATQLLQPVADGQRVAVLEPEPRSTSPSPIERLIKRRTTGTGEFMALPTETNRRTQNGAAQALAPFSPARDCAVRESQPSDDELGLESLEIGSCGTRSTFDPALRTDGLLFRSENSSRAGRSTLEIFSGRPDGIVQLETVKGEDGSLILERKYDSLVSENGLSSEISYTAGSSQSICRVYDPLRNQYGLKTEKLTISTLGSRVEHGYEGRRDQLICTESIVSSSGITTSEFVYEDGHITRDNPVS